ncbi:MAG: aromatic ring-hydroxylating dioxygenase subunit alpha [Thermoanaerobaculia bacterium]|nr:aromatic ring-hydroxylating dioxygenase subunit alpha [Thermoanaerobaculia bacterium]
MSYQFDPRLPFASTIPSSFYVDGATLAAEKTSVFGRTWQLAGHANQVREPGQFFTAAVGDEPLLIVRGNDHELRAMSNVCRHRAGPVAKGEGKRPVLQCGYHGWTYGLDGRLLVTPEFEGVECFDKASVSLPKFRVEEWNDLLFVNLDDAAPPLRDYLGDLVAAMPKHDYRDFRLAARKSWELDCNWKVYVDNYLEGYHIPIVHPGLFRELDYPNYRTETRGNYSIQFAPTKRADRIRTVAGDDQVRYFWLYPNLMLNVYPDNFSTNLIVPISATRTRTVFEWFFRDPEMPKVRSDIAETIAFSDEIQLEDIEICEAVQRGLASSTYTSGRYSPQRENGVHHFHGLYAEAMGIR